MDECFSSSVCSEAELRWAAGLQICKTLQSGLRGVPSWTTSPRPRCYVATSPMTAAAWCCHLLLPRKSVSGQARSDCRCCLFVCVCLFHLGVICIWHFLKLVVRGFLWVLQFPPLLHWLIVSANKIKLKYMLLELCQTYSLNCSFVHRGTCYVARDECRTCCRWFTHDCPLATWTYVLQTVCGAMRRL